MGYHTSVTMGDMVEIAGLGNCCGVKRLAFAGN